MDEHESVRVGQGRVVASGPLTPDERLAAGILLDVPLVAPKRDPKAIDAGEG